MIKKILYKFFKTDWKKNYLKTLVNNGLQVGENFSIQQGCIIDESHCWHIKIGDNVTLAPHVIILAHDGGTFQIVGYTKVKNVEIGNNVFIGARSIVLPGVKIADNIIIGAGSTVTKSLEIEGIYVGTPAKLICTLQDYKNNLKNEMQKADFFDEKYTLRNKDFTADMREEMIKSCDFNGKLFVK